MGFFETWDWVKKNGPVKEYGPQAQFEDHTLRRHNGSATPGYMQIEYHNGQELHVIKKHVLDHDITSDQFGGIQYIQLLHDDGHIQIIKASQFIIDFWAD